MIGKVPVVIKRHEQYWPREPVEIFFYPGTGEDIDRARRRDLFLQAFWKISKKDDNDPLSFYQIASIHGLPSEPYDPQEGDSAVPGRNGYGGYCYHGHPLFPVWHRVYMQLFEQSLIEAAQEVVQDAFAGALEAERMKGMELAKTIRLPYWDWANVRSAQLGVPSIFTAETIQVSYPKAATFVNPLRAFVMPRDVLSPGVDYGEGHLPTSAVYQPPPDEHAPALIAGKPTIRHPNESYQMKVDSLQVALISAAQGLFRPGVFGMLKTDTWDEFSNHSAANAGKGSASLPYGTFYSLEVTHDDVHDKTGGPGGDMAHPEVAAFDPVFFFHHCNVDRLFAIWQRCHPDVWIEDNHVRQEQLLPFRRGEVPGGFVYWTADDTRDLEGAFNVGYPELEAADKRGINSKALQAQMLAYYKPTRFDGVEWSLNVSGIPKFLYSGPYRVLAFLQLDDDAALNTGMGNPHFAGEIFIFAQSKTNCSNCRVQDAREGGMQIGKSISLGSVIDALLLDPISFADEKHLYPSLEHPKAVMLSDIARGTFGASKVRVVFVEERGAGRRKIITPGVGDWKDFTWSVTGEFHHVVPLGTEEVPREVARKLLAAPAGGDVPVVAPAFTLLAGYTPGASKAQTHDVQGGAAMQEVSTVDTHVEGTKVGHTADHRPKRARDAAITGGAHATRSTKQRVSAPRGPL